MVMTQVLLDPTIFLSCSAVLLALLWWLTPSRPSNLPPSPGFTLPLIGHIHLLEKDPRFKFREWRRKHGDVFSLYFGGRLVVVLNGFKVIKQALVKQGEIFSDRPTNALMTHLTNSRGIIDTSGSVWKAQRKASLEILREFGMGKNLLAEKIQEEVSEYVKAISSKNGQPFDMMRLTQISVSNNICSIVFGKRFDYDDSEFQVHTENLDTFFSETSKRPFTQLFPGLRHLPLDPLKISKKIQYFKLVFENFIKPAISRHLRDYEENRADDFISAYIDRIRRAEASKTDTDFVNERNLPKLIMDLFAAGTETTSTTIRWAVVYFLHNPEVQEKCYQEIVRVVGTGRNPQFRDKPEMTYMEATIMEILRMANIVPTSVPHCTAAPTSIAGYSVPKGAVVLVNLDSVLSDPAVWGDPDTFRPERFIGPDGKITKPDEFLPFSAGRRSCLGEALARMELFLYLTTMIQHFRFLPPEDDTLPSLQGILGITYSPKPFTVRFVPRN